MFCLFSRFGPNSIPGIVSRGSATKLGSNRNIKTAQSNLALLSTLQGGQDVVTGIGGLDGGGAGGPGRNPMWSNALVSVNIRQFSEDIKKRRVVEAPVDAILSKPKKSGEEEPRWFHRSPTEKLDNPAYKYLKDHPEYETMFFQHEVYSRLMTEDGKLTPEGESTVNPALKAFIDLSNSNPEKIITDPEYEKLFTDLTSQSSTLTDVELLLFFYNIRKFPKRPRANDTDYKKIWQPFDEICFSRVSQRSWNLEYMFNMADLIYSADLSRESKFHWELVKRLYRRVDHLSKEEFIRMMFCFGGVKSLPDSLSLYNIEYNLPKFIDELTSEEIAVVSVGFLRTKTCVRSKEVLAKMLQVIAEDSTKVPSPNVSAVAKAATLSQGFVLFQVWNDVENFLTAFIPEISRFDVHACAALILLAMKTRVNHPEMMIEIVKKLEGTVSTMRSKDMEYICQGLTTFNIDCPNFYNEIIEELRSRLKNTPLNTFCSSNGRSLVTILHDLNQRNIYPADLISFSLSDEFLGRTFGSSMYTYTPEVLLIDISTGIEAKDYNGPRLSEKYRGFLTKKNMLWIDDEEKNTTSEYQKIARSLLDLCITYLGGPDFCHICNVVPPFKTIGVVYCVNEANQPVPVPENFVAIDDFNIKYIPESCTDNKIKYHAIILFPYNQVTLNTGEIVGRAVMHVRQMEILGYQVHPIYLGLTVSSAEEMKEVVSKIIVPPIAAQPKMGEL